jgi:integrase
MRQKFYIFKRKGNPLYYARFINEAGETITTRSTDCTNRDAAVFTVSNWLRDGLPPNRKRGNKPRLIETEASLQSILSEIAKATTLDTNAALEIVKALRERGLIDTPAVKAGPGKDEFVAFLEKFWDYDKSPYVQEKLAHGQRISKNHCQQKTMNIQNHYVPYFKNKPLRDITRQDLKAFSMSLTLPREKPEHYKGSFTEKLSPASITNIMVTATVALTWASREGLIAGNPSEKLARFTGGTKKRGILTSTEAADVFAVNWPDKRAYVGNLLALTTGMRSGEILALKESDLSTNGLDLNISHSWSRIDGLKQPKNGEEREAPLLPEVRDVLRDLAKTNPWGKNEGFLFYSIVKPDVPMDQKFLIDGLRGAIEAVNKNRKKENPDAELIDWKGRNITFHSHRHYFAARMADKMKPEEIMRITGHKTEAVFEEYADHIEAENLERMRNAASEAFEKVLHFSKRGA